jgi:hypothetical protein
VEVSGHLPATVFSLSKKELTITLRKGILYTQSYTVAVAKKKSHVAAAR